MINMTNRKGEAMKITALLMLIVPCIANADVIESDQQGFIIKIERTASADVKTSYQQFLNVGQWWNGDHTWFGDAENLSIEAKAGGCFCEKSGEKEVLHMTVSYIEPMKEVRLIGGLGPLQMLGVHGGMSWKFKALDSTHTLITQQYHVIGYIKGGMEGFATIVDTVQTIQIDSLIAKLSENKTEG